MGNPKGSITLVEIYDDACPHCRAMNQRIDQLLRQNSNLRLVLRLMSAFGKTSWDEEALVLASVYQHRFQALHEAMMQLPYAADPGEILTMAKNLGIDTKQLIQDSKRPEIKAALANNEKAFLATGAKGIPVLCLGLTRAKKAFACFSGEISFSSLQKIIKELNQIQGDAHA